MRPLFGSIAATVTLALGLAFFSPAASAEGPGTRLRTTPEVPQAMELSVPPVPREAKPCDGLRGEMRERCLSQQRREPDIERRTSGPESTGMGSGATGGTGGSIGAPR